MIRRVLTALDPSPATAEATRSAIKIALATGAKLTGLSIADLGAWESSTLSMGIGTSWLAKQARDEALKAEKEEARKGVDIFVKECARTSVQAEVISTETETESALMQAILAYDLVVFGAGSIPGEESSEKLAVQLSNNGTRPVLVVGEGKGEMSPERVLVALTESAPCWKAFHMFLLLFPPEMIKEMVLVSAYDSPAELPKTEAMLANGETLAKSHGFTAVRTICQQGSPAKVIPAIAKGAGTDTVVLGATTKQSIRHLFTGSVVRSLLDGKEFSAFLYV